MIDVVKCEREAAEKMSVPRRRCVLTLILVNVLLLIETVPAQQPDSEHVLRWVTFLGRTVGCDGEVETRTEKMA